MTSEHHVKAERLYYTASTLMYRGDIRGALRRFRRSARLEPHHKTWQHIGECLLKLNRFSEALIPLAAATIIDKHPRAPALLAETYFALGQFSRAREFAQLAISRLPHYAKMHRLVAEIEEKEGIDIEKRNGTAGDGN